MRDGGGNDFHPRHQRIERRREEIAGAGCGCAEHDNATLNVFPVDLAIDQARGADGANGAARAVIGNRKRIVGTGRDRVVAEQQAVRLDRQRLADRDGGDAKRKRQFDLVAGPEQHRNRKRRAGLARRHVGDPDFRALGECRQRMQESIGRRQAGKRPVAIGRWLHGFRKHRSGREHRRTRRERFRKRRVAVRGPLVDQQQIDRDDLRLELRDRVDDPGYFRARQGIGAAMLHDAVVNRDDRHEVGRRLHAAGEGAQVGQCRLDPVEQAQLAVRMAKADRDGPQSRAEQRNQNIKSSIAHSPVSIVPLFQYPSLLLSEPRHQGRDARGRPALDDQFA